MTRQPAVDVAALYQAYLDAVNADSAAEVESKLAACATPGVRLTSFAPYQLIGRDAVAERLAQFARTNPARRIRMRRAGPIQEHYGVFRVAWEGVGPEGSVALTGEHVGEVEGDRLAAITAFSDGPRPRRPDDGLLGRRVVVTGGSHGIGAATVARLAGAGARVVTCGRDAQALEDVANSAAGPPGEVRAVVADVTEWEQLDGFLAEAERELGGIDVLVSNAGETAMRDFLQMHEADWERCLRVNLLATVRATRTVLPAMIERQWGRIVLMSSSGAKYPTGPWIDYAAAKAAVAATGKALAREYAQHNVTVNTLLPGLIRTPMTERSMRTVGETTGMELEEVATAWAADVPMQRWGRPEEIADVVLFLCSDQATYVNGIAMDVDGGMASHVF